MTDAARSSGGVDFVTFAAANYSDWLELWLASASRSNPESRLFVYDVSPLPSLELKAQVARFSMATVVPWPQNEWRWPAWVETTDFKFFWPGFGLRDEIKRWSRRLRHALTGRRKDDWMIDKLRWVEGKQFFVRICCQKPYIIRDALHRTDRPLAYVDADAVVLERFSSYPGGDSDVAVTVVDADQVRIGGAWEPVGPDGPLPVSVINAGVVFANRSVGAARVLDAWIDEMSRVRHGGADQTALANLLYRIAPTFFETMLPVKANAPSGDFIVACLPCARFNQVRVRPTGIGAGVAIAHFVGSWKQRERAHLVSSIVGQAWERRALGAGRTNS